MPDHPPPPHSSCARSGNSHPRRAAGRNRGARRRRAGRPPGTRRRRVRRGRRRRSRGAADQPPAARGRRGRRTRRRWAPAGTRCGRRRSGRSSSASSRWRSGVPRRPTSRPRGWSARWQRAASGRPSAISVSGAGSSRSMRRRPTRRPWHGLPSRRARGCAGRRPEVPWQLSRIAIPRWRDIPTRCLLLRLPSGSMRPVLQEIRADYLDGDERHPAREGGRLRIESTAATFYSGLPGDKRRPGPTHPFEAIVDVRVGGVVTGRKSGVGVAVVFGWPGAAARAATKGRRDTALHILQRGEDGRVRDCRYVVDRSRALSWTEELARARGIVADEPGMAAAAPHAAPAPPEPQGSLLARGLAILKPAPRAGAAPEPDPASSSPPTGRRENRP